MDKHRSKTSVVTKPRASLKAKWREVGWPALLSAVLMWAAQLTRFELASLDRAHRFIVVDRSQSSAGQARLLLYLVGWLCFLVSRTARHSPGLLAANLWLAGDKPVPGDLLSVVCRSCRHLVQRCRQPLMLVAPIVWTGCELWRSYLLTGYAASTLAHSQYRNPIVLQLADQVGGYGVSFVMVCVAVLALRLFQWQRTRQKPRLWEAAMAGGLMALLLGYGAWRLQESQRMAQSAQPLLRVALIQEIRLPCSTPIPSGWSWLGISMRN